MESPPPLITTTSTCASLDAHYVFVRTLLYCILLGRTLSSVLEAGARTSKGHRVGCVRHWVMTACAHPDP